MEQKTENNGWVKGISVITLFVEELAVAKQFYLDVFSVPIVFEDDESAVFGFGNVMVNLLKSTAVAELIEPAKMALRDAGQRMIFTINVEDVDALCNQLTSRGVALLNGPMDRPWGPRTASFRDPAGHIWEIAS